MCITNGMQYGKQWLKKIKKIENVEDPLIAVCEIPAESRCKYALDKKTGHLQLDRIMAPDCMYPTNYGFVPRTLASDQMEMDILVITSEPLLPLTTVECRVVGGFTVKAEKEPPEHKLLAVAVSDAGVRKIADLADVDASLKTKLEHFFKTYKLVEDVKVAFQGWGARAQALEWLEESLRAAKRA